MGQGEILKALEEKGSLTEHQIAEMLDITVNSVNKCLEKLMKHNEVERKFSEVQSDGQKRCGCYIFKIKIIEGGKNKK